MTEQDHSNNTPAHLLAAMSSRGLRPITFTTERGCPGIQAEVHGEPMMEDLCVTCARCGVGDSAQWIEPATTLRDRLLVCNERVSIQVGAAGRQELSA